MSARYAAGSRVIVQIVEPDHGFAQGAVHSMNYAHAIVEEVKPNTFVGGVGMGAPGTVYLVRFERPCEPWNNHQREVTHFHFDEKYLVPAA